MTHDDVRRLALALPGVEESAADFAFSVVNEGKHKGIAWSWKERVTPKQPRVPNPRVLAVLTTSLADKDLILAADATKFFTEPHYHGYPAVLVRLDAVTPDDLRPLLEDAWRRATAPKRSSKKRG